MEESRNDDSLFTPLRWNGAQLSHRIAMAPMTRSRAGTERVANDLMREYYVQRASAALIITEGTQVSQQGIGYLGTPGIHTDEQENGWRNVVEGVHAAGGRILAQLWHVGRVSHRSFQPGGEAPVAPSAIAAPGDAHTIEGKRPRDVPRALETHEIAGIVDDFERAARRALAARFDGVELHGANGYLIDQFLRDGSNHRTDAYGGPVVNRARLLLEVVEALIGVWGAERVAVRLAPRGSFNGMSDSDPATTFSYAARELGARGVGLLHVIDPVGGVMYEPGDRLAPLLRRAFGEGLFMLNGGYDRNSASRAIEAGEADLVSFGVPFLANPDLPARLRSGAVLNTPRVDTFYTPGPTGYTDYPSLDQ